MLSVLVLMVPTTLFAEELLPALCKQVLTPDTNTSVPQVVMNHIIEKVRGVPSQIIGDVTDKVDEVTGTLAEALEAQKNTPKKLVLGTSTASVNDSGVVGYLYDKAIDVAAFLLRHWLWTLSALVALIIGWSLRT